MQELGNSSQHLRPLLTQRWIEYSETPVRLGPMVNLVAKPDLFQQRASPRRIFDRRSRCTNCGRYEHLDVHCVRKSCFAFAAAQTRIATVMRMIIRSVLFVALSVSVATIVMPLKAAPPAAAQSKCCEKMKMNPSHNGCGREMPKLPQDLQCCVACMNALTAVLNAQVKVFPPSFREQSFADFFEHGRTRVERPPVPPPRFSFA